MIRNLIEAGLISIGLVLFDIFVSKNRKNPLVYIAAFIFMFGATCVLDMIFPSKLQASEFSEYFEFPEAYVLTPQQRREYTYYMNWHYNEAGKSVGEASLNMESIRNYAAKTASKAIVYGLATGIVSRNIVATACAVAIAALEKIIGDLGDLWESINTNLNNSQYHVEMALFYRAVLDNDGK